MAGVGRATSGWCRQVRGLFGFGTVGGLSDGQLLDAFVSRRGDDSEAAFEELMHRHGPMVLRVCRGVLRDPQDAEDAFQATFLVLAHRAGAIRRRDSVASWLFGVSQRVAAQARLRAARRRAGEQHVAGQTFEAYRPVENREEPEALIEEIDRLPERLRTAVVLCYLEGLTYDAAARRLGLSEGSIRGRLARARDQLRRRLTRRGLTLPAGLVAAGMVAEGQVQAAASVSLSASLVGATTRVALGVQAGEAAAILARGVLRSMVLGHLRSAALIVLAVLGSGLMAWQALAARDDDKAPPTRRPEPARTASRAAASPNTKRPADGPCAITGRVSVEGTGEPVPGARLDAFLGSYSGNPIIDASRDFIRTVRTGADGRYRVELPAGYASIVLMELPPGYYRADRKRWSSDLILSRDAPIAREDYTVRRGRAWRFDVRRDDGGPLVDAKVTFLVGNPADLKECFALSDRSGKAIVTMPLDGQKLVGDVGGPHVDVNPTRHELEYESGFNPDAVRSVARDSGKPGRLYEAVWPEIARAIARAPEKSSRFRITDENGKTAVIGAMVPIEPIIEHGKLVIRMTTSSDPRVRRRGALTGLVLDPRGQPVAGARVVLAYLRDQGRQGFLSRDKEHWVTTDSQGRYRIGSIPSEPDVLLVVAAKPGFSRTESEAFAFKPGRDDRPVEVASVRLGRDVTLSGTVLDLQGRPVEGAWVEVNPTSVRNDGQFARTDRAGRFAFQGLSSGASRVNVQYGDLYTGMNCPADTPSRDVVLQLHERPKPGAPRPVAKAQRARPRFPAVGQPAFEWQVGNWSDGQTRKLADYRGRIVVLDFWDIGDGSSVSSLPVLNKLKERYEPLGVVFLSIHAPGGDERAINRVLLANQSNLVYAIDQTPVGQTDHDRGVTANLYGVRGLFPVFLIDREGKIAMRDGDPGLAPKILAIIKEVGIAPGTKRITHEQSNALLEKLLTGELENVLKSPNRRASNR